MDQQYEEMTVAELRAQAKEQGIKLPAGATKQVIIDILTDSEETLSTEPVAAQPRRYTTASIISDDDEDAEITPSSPSPARPVMPTVKPREGTGTLASISSKAPAFTLEGSRSWHNPRAFQTQNSYSGRNAWSASQRSGYIAQEKAALEASRNGQPPEEYEYVSGRSVPVSRPGQDRHPEGPDYPGSDPLEAGSELYASGEYRDGSGTLEILPDGYGFLRSSIARMGKNDIYVSNAQIRRFNLHTGDLVEGRTRPGREGERYCALMHILRINGKSPEEKDSTPYFEDLTPEYPLQRLTLSDAEHYNPLHMSLDLLCPLGAGQRALVLIPEEEEDHVLLTSSIANAIASSMPEADVMTLLIGSKPEDIPEQALLFENGIIPHPFGTLPDQIIRSTEMALEKAKREAEQKKDAVILVDSMDALVCAYFLAGRGGDESYTASIARLYRFWGTARKLQEGGSVTIIGFCRHLNEALPVWKSLKGAASAVLVLRRRDGAAMPLVPDLSKSFSARGAQLLTREEKILAEKLQEKISVQDDPSEALARLMTSSEDMNLVLAKIMGV